MAQIILEPEPEPKTFTYRSWSLKIECWLHSPGFMMKSRLDINLELDAHLSKAKECYFAVSWSMQISELCHSRRRNQTYKF